MAVLKGNQNRLQDDVESLAKQRSALTPMVEGAADFEAAWAAIPLDQRAPSVVAALNKAGVLQQAAEIVLADPAYAKGPQDENSSDPAKPSELNPERE